MTDMVLTGADILTPEGRVPHKALICRAGRIAEIAPADAVPAALPTRSVEGLLVPGLVDLQVNGGGGVMFNDAPDVETLRKIAQAHARVGTTSILPTLITDTPAHVGHAIAAVEQAIAQNVPGIVGLHLEGPHLAPARKGAHDGALIRPMGAQDLQQLLEAARRLPLLKVTVAPESVSPEQIAQLSAAGVLVSLGHTDATFENCQTAADAGARCVTHLFNAQSQMVGRHPGTVGAGLSLGALSAGLIADGIHVHPATMRAALAAKAGPGRVFFVSDAMATVGSDLASFRLNGRTIHRSGDRLTLADGTLAGAHLELLQAVRNGVDMIGLASARSVAMASQDPANLIDRPDLGRIAPGAQADFLLLDQTLHLRQVWQRGVPLLP